MNEIRRALREDEEIAAICAIVGRHAMPSFVSGFDLTLDVYDDEPIVVINYHLGDDGAIDREARASRTRALYEMSNAVRDDLIENYPARYPYSEFGHERRAG